MAKFQPLSRDRSLFAISLEQLEARWLLSGLGRVYPFHEPSLSSVEFSAARALPNQFRVVVPTQHQNSFGQQFASSAAVPGRAIPTAGQHPAPPSDAAGAVSTRTGEIRGRDTSPANPGPGAQSVGREDPPAFANNGIATPPGRALGIGKVSELTPTNHSASTAGGKEVVGEDSNGAGLGKGRIPPGLLLVEARGFGSFAAAPASQKPAVSGVGQTSTDRPASGVDLASTALRSELWRSESSSRTSLLVSSLPASIDWSHFSTNPLEMLAILSADPSVVEGLDRTVPSEVAHQLQTRSLVLSKGTSGDVPFVRGSGDLMISSASSSTRHHGKLSPEVSVLKAEPTYVSVRSLLGELERLRDQLQSAGEYAFGWLFDREISDWIVLTLVVAVTLEIARREIWHSEVEPSWVDDEEFEFPWMV